MKVLKKILPLMVIVIILTAMIIPAYVSANTEYPALPQYDGMNYYIIYEIQADETHVLARTLCAISNNTLRTYIVNNKHYDFLTRTGSTARYYELIDNAWSFLAQRGENSYSAYNIEPYTQHMDMQYSNYDIYDDDNSVFFWLRLLPQPLISTAQLQPLLQQVQNQTQTLVVFGVGILCLMLLVPLLLKLYRFL